MTRICRRFLAPLTVVLFSISLFAQEGQPAAQTPPVVGTPAVAQRTDADRAAYRKAMEEADQKIADEVKAHSELMKNLDYLTTQIGARLTGSPQMQAASDWTLKRFKDYGIDAHLETAQIAHGWTRGLEDSRDHQPHPEAHRHSRLWLEQGHRRRGQRRGDAAQHREA